MLHRLILNVTKFQLPTPERLGTVVKNILGSHHAPPPCQIGGGAKSSKNYIMDSPASTPSQRQLHYCNASL